MAWVTTPESVLWEYSTAPNTDRKTQDTYDYDANSDHTLGIRTNTDGTQVYVLARQITLVTNDHPGYGELIKQ